MACSDARQRLDLLNGDVVELGDVAAGEFLTRTGDMIEGGNVSVLPTKIRFPGVLTPSQITANQNNYAPTGHADVFAFRLDTDASRDLTGLAGGGAGRFVTLFNIGANDLVLKEEAAGSTAANRFKVGGDLTVAPGTAVPLWYDTTSSRWRLANARTTAAGGWSAATGTATRSSFATGSVTLASLAEAVKALIDDLMTKRVL